MTDKLETEFPRHALLQSFDIGVGEFDDAPCLDVEQMIVVLAHGRFIAAAPVSKIMPLKDALRRKKLQRPVNGRKRNSGIERVRTAMHFLDIGMIGCRRKHLCDDSALSRHAQAVLGATRFNRRKAFCASRRHGIRHELEAALSLNLNRSGFLAL